MLTAPLPGSEQKGWIWLPDQGETSWTWQKPFWTCRRGQPWGSALVCVTVTISTKHYRACQEETADAWPLFHVPEGQIPVCTHAWVGTCACTHRAVLSSGLATINSKLSQLFCYESTTLETTFQKWLKNVIFWPEGHWRRGWNTQVTSEKQKPKKITEIKRKTKSRQASGTQLFMLKNKKMVECGLCGEWALHNKVLFNLAHKKTTRFSNCSQTQTRQVQLTTATI